MVKTLAPAHQTSIAAGKSKGPEVGRRKTSRIQRLIRADAGSGHQRADVVIQFDGRVVEVFGDHSNEVVRAQVALMKEPQILGPNRKGRRLVSVGATTIGVDDDEWARRTPLLDTIREAIRAARNAAPA
jgi:hypothetical protein